MTPHRTDSLCSASGNTPDTEIVQPSSVACGALGSEATTAECSAQHPSALAQLIERERVELLQIGAMLKCLHEVLLYADDDDSVMHADVANVCARLINESVGRLDKLPMQGAGRNELDEPAASEWCGSNNDRAGSLR